MIILLSLIASSVQRSKLLNLAWTWELIDCTVVLCLIIFLLLCAPNLRYNNHGFWYSDFKHFELSKPHHINKTASGPSPSSWTFYVYLIFYLGQQTVEKPYWRYWGLNPYVLSRKLIVIVSLSATKPTALPNLFYI